MIPRGLPASADSPPGSVAWRRVSELADTLRRSGARRALFFLLAAALNILATGYHTGTFDQIIHLPMLRAYADPGLYAGDPIVALRTQHYSFFWFLFLPTVGSGLLEAALFLAHVAATWATFAATWELALALFGKAESGLLAVCALALPHTGFVGFPLIEFSLLNRSAALPLILLAFALYFRGRPAAAFGLLGATYNLHLVSVNFAVLFLGVAMLVERRQVGVRGFARAGAAFLGAAAPVLIWKFGSNPELDMSVRADWLEVVGQGMFRHIWHPLDGPASLLWLVAGGLGGLWLGTLALRASQPRHAVALRAMLAAGAALLVLQEAIAHIWPATALMQLQLSRVCVLLLLVAYLCAAHAVSEALRAGRFPRGRWLAAGLSLIVFPWPALALGGWVIAERARRRIPAAAVVAAVAILAAGCALALRFSGVWQPGIYINGPNGPWEEAQRWARDHTPREAVFVTPPGPIILYESDWRVYSERRTLASISDLLELALQPDGFGEWLPRFEAVAPGAAARFNGDYFENVAVVQAAYASLGSADFEALACRFGAHYAVVESTRALPFPLVFGNAGYRIYDLQRARCETVNTIGNAHPGQYAHPRRLVSRSF